jgi:hypothetical protein
LACDASHDGSTLYSDDRPLMNFLLATTRIDGFQDEDAPFSPTFVPSFGATATAWTSSFLKAFLVTVQPRGNNSDLITNAATNIAANLHGLQTDIFTAFGQID